MLKKEIIPYGLLALSMLCVAAGWFAPLAAAEDFEYTEEYEYKEYIVKKGDTLWAISRNELEDGFQWPLVWRENLKIANPDQISPGQVIIIPIRELKRKPVMPEAVVDIEQAVPAEVAGMANIPEEMAKVEEVPPEVKPEGRKIERKELEPLITTELLLAAGYITRVTPDAGEISGSAAGRITFGQNDEIYIKTKRFSKVGQKFYVISNQGEVRHPYTHKLMGTLMKVSGILVVDEAGTKGLKARVLASYDAMSVGDALDYYFDVETPYIVGEPGRPYKTGYVIASNYMRLINGTYDIVFIDKGKDHGLKLGDVLMTLVPGTDDRLNSIIQLVNIRKDTSLAIIIKSVGEVQRGDSYQGIR